MSIHDNVFDLLAAAARQRRYQEAAAKVAAMPEWERLFVLGLLRHEGEGSGDAGIEAVVAWLAEREDA